MIGWPTFFICAFKKLVGIRFLTNTLVKADRKKKLEAAGYNYKKVQKEVNKLL